MNKRNSQKMAVLNDLCLVIKERENISEESESLKGHL